MPSTDKNGILLDAKAVIVMVDMVKNHKMPKQPLFYASGVIDPDSIYKMRPDQLTFYKMSGSFDKSTEVVYICGKNVCEELIEKGITFQN